MTKIIVPLDGSQEAELALPHARMLAGPDPVMLLSSIWHGEPIAPRAYLEDRAARLAGEPTETKVVLDEVPSDAIAAAARDATPAMVCMATHGRSTLGEIMLGSAAEAVTRATTDPVMLVGPKAAFDHRRFDARNLVVAVDGAGTAADLIPAAATFAARHRLHLWTIEAISPAPYPFVANADIPSAPHQGPGLDAAVELLGRDGRSTETKLLIAVDPADAIITFADELPASFVVVGNHARHGLARVALGSTAMRVVHRCPCPVLVVRQ